ncbi:MAG: LemA family protein [Xanthobacteraceae bacterium]
MKWIIAAVAVIAAAVGISIYNQLVRDKNRVAEGWSGIDVQLRRRADLVPNLVETVKGYASHERTVLEELVAARNSVTAASDVQGQAAASRSLQMALGNLFALAEAYPQLKADKNFLALQGQLAEIEDQLQMARRYYNGATRDYNIRLQSFPDVILARLFGFTASPFFEIDNAADRAAPQVSFNRGAP